MSSSEDFVVDISCHQEDNLSVVVVVTAVEDAGIRFALLN
jgi:hypothetical protein